MAIAFIWIAEDPAGLSYAQEAAKPSKHEAGESLILTALKANPLIDDEWAKVHGLLGCEMLDVDLPTRDGYRSLFLSFVGRFKMESTIFTRKMHLHMSESVGGHAVLTPKELRSIVARREVAIYSIASELQHRYTLDNQENWDRLYSDQSDRECNRGLWDAADYALGVYRSLRTLGYKDRTLLHSIGVACASLDYNRSVVLYPEYGPAPVFGCGGETDLLPREVFLDALKATLANLRKPGHGMDFLEALGWEMQARGLASSDGMLMPAEEEIAALLKIVGDDLARVREGTESSDEENP